MALLSDAQIACDAVFCSSRVGFDLAFGAKAEFELNDSVADLLDESTSRADVVN